MPERRPSKVGNAVVLPDHPTPRPNGRRFVSGVFDWLTLMVIASTITWAWHDTIKVRRDGRIVEQMQPSGGAQVLTLGFVALFWVGCYSRWGRTPGKALVGLRLEAADGTPAGFRRSLVRWLVTDVGWVIAWLAPRSWESMTAYLPSVWPLFIYVPVLLDPFGRGIHDRVAGTVVRVAPLERPPWKQQRGIDGSS